MALFANQNTVLITKRIQRLEEHVDQDQTI